MSKITIDIKPSIHSLCAWWKMKRDNAQKLTLDKCCGAFCNVHCYWWRQDMATFLWWCVHWNVNGKTKCQFTHCTPSAVRSNTPYKSVIKSNGALVLSDRDNDDGWNNIIAVSSFTQRINSNSQISSQHRFVYKSLHKPICLFECMPV